MKLSGTVISAAMLFAYAALSSVATAATDEEKLAGIRKGLAYLHATEQPGGYWEFSGYEQAATGVAVAAFLANEEAWDINAPQYQAAVDKAVAYLLSTANTREVSTRNDGVNVCPGRAGTCTSVYWFGNGKPTFTTGLVVPAIVAYGQKAGADVVATSNGPLSGMTWRQIAQAITNALAASQSTTANGNRSGGWSYLIPGNGDADSSSTESATLSLAYNEILGITTPQAVKDELKNWLSRVQADSGAVCSQPGSERCGASEAGGWLVAMKLVGFDITSTQLQATLSFLNKHWRSPAGTSDDIFSNSTVMWAVHKALSAIITPNNTTQIAERMPDCLTSAREPKGEQSGGGLCRWTNEFVDWVVKNQKPNGSWGRSESGDPLSTALYLNLLGTQIPILVNGPSDTSTLQPREANSATSTPTTYASVRQTSSAIEPKTAAQGGGQVAAISSRLRKRDRKGVTALAVSDDGSALASASVDKRIVIWNPLTGNRRIALQGSSGVPTGIAFARGADTITSVGTDSIVRLWDLASGRELNRFAGHEQPIRAVAASPDGTLIATVGEETRILLWDQTTRKLSKILFGAKDFVSAVAFSPDSRVLAAGSDDARVLLFDARGGQVLFTLLGHSGPLDAVTFSPNGTLLASGGQDTVIRLWDTARGQQQHALTGHSAPVRAITFSPDGRIIASAGEDTTVKLWNVVTGTLEKSLPGLPSAVNSLVFDPKGRFLASATESGEITLWNVTTGAKLLTISVAASL